MWLSNMQNERYAGTKVVITSYSIHYTKLYELINSVVVCAKKAIRLLLSNFWFNRKTLSVDDISILKAEYTGKAIWGVVMTKIKDAEHSP